MKTNINIKYSHTSICPLSTTLISPLLPDTFESTSLPSAPPDRGALDSVLGRLTPVRTGAGRRGHFIGSDCVHTPYRNYFHIVTSVNISPHIFVLNTKCKKRIPCNKVPSLQVCNLMGRCRSH